MIANQTIAATVEHEGIEYDLYDDEGALWSVALAGSSVDLIDMLKKEVLQVLQYKLVLAQAAEHQQARNEALEDRAASIAAYA